MTAPRAPRHLGAAAEILAELAAELEELGARLCGDPEVAERHMTELQAIDLIVQKQQHLSDLLTAKCPYDAVEKMRIEELKHRIAESLGH